MVAAATPVPVPLQISRIETRNTGAYSGGHELSFFVDGTAGATAQPAAAETAVPAAAPPPACDGCGVVASVTKVKGKTNYIGAIAGGVAGAALGNQVGKGTGNTAATILGAVGGAVAGREIEKNVKSGNRYDVAVKLDNGTSRTMSYNNDPGFKSGAKVQFVGDVLQARP